MRNPGQSAKPWQAEKHGYKAVHDVLLNIVIFLQQTNDDLIMAKVAGGAEKRAARI
jgi:hypothetical protein